MALIERKKIGTKGFTGFGNGVGFTGFGVSSSQVTSDQLLQAALGQGGSVSQVAQELMHPETSMLSTVGDKFKNAFSNFVNIISVPGQVVAGTISGDITIKEAIQKDINPSDVIWGDTQKNRTTTKKVGDFLVRTATDILLDPLTYVTFGAAKGIFGLTSAPKVTLKGRAATGLGLNELVSRELSKEGLDVFRFLKNIEHQTNGTAKVLNLTKKTTTHEFAEKELRKLLSKTVDAPLGFDFSKRALSNILERYPQLTETLIDKGGIKFFGKSILSGQKIRAVGSLIPGMTHIDKLTQPIRGALSAMFDPAVVKVENKFIRLPEEFVNIRQAAQDLSTSLGDERLLKLSDVISANKLNVNEARLLTASIEAGKIPVDSRLANAYKQLTGFNADELSWMKSSGVKISRLDNHVPHILVKTNINKIPFTTPPKQKAAAAIQRKLTGGMFKYDDEAIEALEKTIKGGDKKLIDETFNELKNSGFEIFDDNVVTALAKRSIDNTRVGVSRRFITSVAESFGTPSSVAPDGFVKINSKVFKEEGSKVAKMLDIDGEDILYHPAVAKSIENFVGAITGDDSTAVVLKAFDSVQNLWKASVTTIFPAFHGRNGISNVFLHMMDLGVHSLNPQLHSMSGAMIINDRSANRLQRLALKSGKAGVKAKEQLQELLEKKMFTDRSGYNWTFGELRQVAKENNVAFSRTLTGALDITESPEQFVKTLFQSEQPIIKKVARKGLPITQQFAPFSIGREFGRAVEEQARLVDFLANLKNTGDVMHAAQRTKQFLFDYQNLTGFERNVMKRFVPFYTFTRKNLELQAKSLFKTPGRTDAQLTALQNLGDVLGGGELTTEEREALPDWIKDGIGILKSRKDGTVEILGSLGTPLEQPFQQFQANILLGSISPIIRTPVEQFSGYNFFQGKLMSDVTNAAAFKKAPAVIKDFIGYTDASYVTTDGRKVNWHVSLRPERMNLVQNFPFTARVLSSLKQMQNETISEQSKTLQFLVGVRPFTFDIEVEQKKREKELRTKMEKALGDAGLGYKLNRFILKK